MTPEQIAASYDQIAANWLDRSSYGFAAINRAITFVKNKGTALDAGCGTGRCFELLMRHGFRIDGIDLSSAMITFARRYPFAQLVHADICAWQLPQLYDLIVAWDSIWHVPLNCQEAVLMKLCQGLSSNGVILFSMGGTDQQGEKQDSVMGPPMYHATLGIPKILQLLANASCICRHLEYDQYPESHLYLIAQKSENNSRTSIEEIREIRLRPIEHRDLPGIFTMQLDPESNQMAVTNPRTKEEFYAHWTNLLADSDLKSLAIISGESLIGVISSFPMEGRDHIGYWIDRAYWGKGIASKALHLLIREVTRRPLVATVATSNIASIRVLLKNGFILEEVYFSPASERYPECEVANYVLR